MARRGVTMHAFSDPVTSSIRLFRAPASTRVRCLRSYAESSVADESQVLLRLLSERASTCDPESLWGEVRR